MPRLQLSAPCRLHFGLYGLASGTHRKFGGVGMMIDRPRLRLEAVAAPAFEVAGPDGDRLVEFARRRQAFYREATLPACRLTILDAPPAHAGLGSGTQAALATAALLNAWVGRENGPPEELARSVDRGLRSAVGTYGFALGGLIAERGRAEDEPFSPLDARIEVCPDWRFVLLRPPGEPAVFGRDEERRITELPPVPAATTTNLVRLVRERLLPATATADFPAFTAALYEFNHDAGLLFAAAQGGPYHGPILSEWVAVCRSLGAVGVGQSSWGPTIFAAFANAAEAEAFVARLRQAPGGKELGIEITAAAAHGAVIQRLSE